MIKYKRDVTDLAWVTTGRNTPSCSVTERNQLTAVNCTNQTILIVNETHAPIGQRCCTVVWHWRRCLYRNNPEKKTKQSTLQTKPTEIKPTQHKPTANGTYRLTVSLSNSNGVNKGLNASIKTCHKPASFKSSTVNTKDNKTPTSSCVIDWVSAVRAQCNRLQISRSGVCLSYSNYFSACCTLLCIDVWLTFDEENSLETLHIWPSEVFKKKIRHGPAM